MKENFERVDFGGHPKYRATLSSALLPERGSGATKKSSFSLFDLNPHKATLGLNPQDFKAEKLCLAPAACESLPGATAAAATATSTAAQPANATAVTESLINADQAAVGAVLQNTEHSLVADGIAGQDNLAQAKGPGRSDSSQAQCLVPGLTTAAPIALGNAHHTACVGPASVGVDGESSPSRGSDFIVIDSSDTDPEHNSDSEADLGEDVAEDAAAAGAKGPAADSLKQAQGTQMEDREVPQEVHDQHSHDDDSSMSISGSSDGDHTATGDDSEDEEFIPLLHIPSAGDAEGATGSALQQQQQQRQVGYQPPWLPRLAHFSSPCMRLHNEIVAFCQMLAPTAEEVAARADSLSTLRRVVCSIWPAAEVQAFGSYETGLYTPASDTDVVVVGSGMSNAQSGLKALAQALEAQHLVRNMQLVLSARVPIIKFEMIESGLAFDVSWEVLSGPRGAQVVKQLLQEWPALKPLALVLKVFLTQRELNEVYTGGIGSYTLIIMIVAMLQLHHSRRPHEHRTLDSSHSHKRPRRDVSRNTPAAPLDCNLGLLLVDFLRLYGRVLNLNRVAISCNGSGCFFDRSMVPGFEFSNRRKGGFVSAAHMSLAVQDPIDLANDTARGSFNMKLVRQVLDHAYQLLDSPCPSHVSVLGRIIHLAPVVSGRSVPAWCIEDQRQQQQHRRSHQRSRSDAAAGDGGRKDRRSSDRRRGSDGRGVTDTRAGSGRRHSGSGGGSGPGRSNRDPASSHADGGAREGQGQRDGRSGHSHQQARHRGRNSSNSSSRHRRGGSNSNKSPSSGNNGKRRGPSPGQQHGERRHMQPSPPSNRGGFSRNSSRQSFGSDAGQEYAHRNKRQRY